jgi:hypothetical protein
VKSIAAFPSGNIYDMTLEVLEEIEIELAMLIVELKAQKRDSDEAFYGEE